MRVLTITTSFPTENNSASGVFIERFLNAFPAKDKHVVLTPDVGLGDRFVSQRWKVVACRYSFRRFQCLFHGSGGGPSKLAQAPWLILLLPCVLMSLLYNAKVLAKSVDVIHAHWTLAGLVAVLAGKMTGTPVVVTFHGQDVNCSREKFGLGWLLKICVLYADTVVVVSRGMCADLQRLYPDRADRIHFVSNGVSRDFCYPNRIFRRGGELKLLTVSSLIPSKNVICLIDAIAKVDRSLKISLAVVGNGPERKQLIESVIQLGVENRVSFLGLVPASQMAELYKDYDLFVSASLAEGRPSVMLESMASGLPHLCSEIPAHVELSEESRAGLLFDPLNCDALAESIESVHSEFDRLDVWGRRAMRYMERSGLYWEQTVLSYKKLYIRAINHKKT